MERRRLEFSVGIFMIVGLLCLTYLALTLGHLGWGGSRYDVYATFPTVSGLKNKAAVTMAGRKYWRGPEYSAQGRACQCYFEH